jgi:hypothetical protein
LDVSAIQYPPGEHLTFRRRWPTAALRGWPGAPGPDGRATSLRWILVHLMEEYAEHNGHADLLRESVDGLTEE